MLSASDAKGKTVELWKRDMTVIYPWFYIYVFPLSCTMPVSFVVYFREGIL